MKYIERQGDFLITKLIREEEDKTQNYKTRNEAKRTKRENDALNL